MLSTLVATTNVAGDRNRGPINAQYRALVADLYSTGRCIYLADVDPVNAEGSNWLRHPDDFMDEVHPNDGGHRKMASIFLNAILRAESHIKPAPEIEVEVPGCDKQAGNGIDPHGQTQKGSGEDDGIYKHKSLEKGVLLELESAFDRNQWRFVRLFSPDYDDLVGWFEKSPGVHAFGVWKNSADHQGKFTKIADLNPDLFCNPIGLNFIDMNAGKLKILADLLAVRLSLTAIRWAGRSRVCRA